MTLRKVHVFVVFDEKIIDNINKASLATKLVNKMEFYFY